MAAIESCPDGIGVSSEGKLKELRNKIPKMRELFLSKYGDKLSTYYSQDVERVKSDEDWCIGVLEYSTADGDTSAAADVINTILSFRKEHCINEVKKSTLPADLIERNPMFYKNTDKYGRKILHWKINLHRKGKDVAETKQFVAMRMEEHYKDSPLEGVCVLFDFTGAGLAQLDVEMTKFIIGCFSTYFPSLADCILLYEMPWVLGALMKLVRSMLSERDAKYVISAGKSNIQTYINPDQLEEHMKDS